MGFADPRGRLGARRGDAVGVELHLHEAKVAGQFADAAAESEGLERRAEPFDEVARGGLGGENGLGGGFERERGHRDDEGRVAAGARFVHFGEEGVGLGAGDPAAFDGDAGVALVDVLLVQGILDDLELGALLGGQELARDGRLDEGKIAGIWHRLLSPHRKHRRRKRGVRASLARPQMIQL